jgi:hypothetical protein
MAYCDVSDLDAFLVETTRRGLRTAVLAWRAEYGQHPTPEAVRYERLNLVTVLAYDAADGCIVRVSLDGADRAKVRLALERTGLSVEERSRNTV